MQGEEEKT